MPRRIGTAGGGGCANSAVGQGRTVGVNEAVGPEASAGARPVKSVSSPARSSTTAGTDGVVKVWDTGTAQEVLTLKEHKGAVTGLAFSPDGRLLLTGGADKTARVFDATLTKE